jgi:hypothetical protein
LPASLRVRAIVGHGEGVGVRIELAWRRRVPA